MILDAQKGGSDVQDNIHKSSYIISNTKLKVELIFEKLRTTLSVGSMRKTSDLKLLKGLNPAFGNKYLMFC